MTNPLEELVRLVAYMFYDPDATMVLTGLIGNETGQTKEELSKSLKYKKTELGRVLGILHNDHLVEIETQYDDEGYTQEEMEHMSEAKKKKLAKDYYAIDYKSFVDAVNLKIKLVLKELKERCGPEDEIFYQCERCQKKILLSDLLSSGDGQFICPICKGNMNELDDSDEINARRQQMSDFIEITKPLLDLIKQTEGLVMINDVSCRCKPDSMLEKKKYIDQKIRAEKEKRTPKVHQPSVNTAAILNHSSNVRVVLDNGIKTQQAEIQNVKQFVEKAKEPIPEVEKKTININGKEYTAEELTEEVLADVPDSDFERVMSFKEQNE